jgi:hypothetical protein
MRRLVLGIIVLCSGGTLAQTQPNLSANDLVRQVVANELEASKQDHTHWMYQVETQKNGTKQVSETIETKQGDLTRVVARNGQPLSDQQKREEDQRIEKFLHDPEEQKKQQQNENEDTRKTEQLFKLLPEALNFSYAERNGNTVKLNFEPNPAFHPPTHEARAFHEIEGQMTIDERQKRFVEINGHLKNPVHFGILAHLDAGGTFDVRQEEEGPNHWQITLLKVNMKGKALFFKTISVQQDEVRSHFHQVPDTLTLAQAKDILQKQSYRGI